MKDASPLRYPGGKWRISNFFERVIQLNRLSQPSYVEPYAGGASLALSLLFKEQVSEIFLNDLDPAIYSFWYSILKFNKDFLQLIIETPITLDEWTKQKAIYRKGSSGDKLALGFATFFLNRTNHSGILNGGIIGGRKQQGVWTIEARFNRVELQRRIKRIGQYKNRIHLSCKDAMEFLDSHKFSKKSLIYLDPPYYETGKRLYLNNYKPSDHTIVKDRILKLRSPWIISYDDVPAIRKLYKGIRSRQLKLLYTARSARSGKEVLFFAPELSIPGMI